MDSIVIKLIDRNEPNAVAEAEDELRAAGYSIRYRGEAELVGVDATKHGNGEQVYDSAVVLVGDR